MSEISQAVKDGKFFLTQFRSLVDFVRVLEGYGKLEEEVVVLRKEHAALTQETARLQAETAAAEKKLGALKAEVAENKKAAAAAVEEGQQRAAAFVDDAHKLMADETAVHLKALDELKAKTAALQKKHDEEAERLERAIEGLEAKRDAVAKELHQLKERFS